MTDDPRVEAVARVIAYYDPMPENTQAQWKAVAGDVLAAADAVDPLRLALAAVLDELDQDEALIADLDACAYNAAAADDEVRATDEAGAR